MPDTVDRKPSFLVALLAFLIPVAIILYGTAVMKIGAILPLVLATVVACLFAMYTGYKWQEIEAGMIESISRVMVAILILVAVGMLIGVWILAGTIPTIVYWGLTLIAPKTFLVTAFLLCAIASTATGTSFGTIGTMGVALLGVGQALGFPLPLIVGTIVSGAYFGDKMSPVSDSTNITASICEVPLFPHIASMMWTTIPAAALAGLIYLFIGFSYPPGAAVEGNIPLILTTMTSHFHISLWTLLPPVLLIILAYRRYPAIPLLIACVAAGALVAWLLQGAALKEILGSMMGGYKSATGVKQVDVLFSRGGISSIMGTLVLLISGVSFGGVLEKMRALEVLIDAALRWARSTGRLILSVVVSCYIILLGTGSQMVAVIIPGRAFAKTFKERDIHLRVLSRTCEDAGTIGCPLVPWSVHAFYIMGILGVSAYEFAPYAFLNWLVPLFSITYGYTGWAIWRQNGQPVRSAVSEKSE